MEEFATGRNDLGVLEWFGQGIDCAWMGVAIGIEEESKVARHGVEALVVGGSESTVFVVSDELDFGVVGLDVFGGAVFTGIINYDDFVDRFGFECVEGGFEVVEGVVTDDNDGYG